LDAAFIAADATNGNYFVASGRDVLIVYNSDVSGQTLTINSAPDASGRKADLIAYPIAAGGFMQMFISAASLFTQTDGTVQLTASANTVKFLVLSV
jgi:hypothetical protein